MNKAATEIWCRHQFVVFWGCGLDALGQMVWVTCQTENMLFQKELGMQPTELRKSEDFVASR